MEITANSRMKIINLLPIILIFVLRQKYE